MNFVRKESMDSLYGYPNILQPSRVYDMRETVHNGEDYPDHKLDGIL